jgi:hypothetical protein
MGISENARRALILAMVTMPACTGRGKPSHEAARFTAHPGDRQPRHGPDRGIIAADFLSDISSRH